MKAEDFLTEEKIDKLQLDTDDNNGIIDFQIIENIMEEYHVEKMRSISTMDFVNGFKQEFGIDKEDNSYSVVSFNHFAKCTTLKELSEICVRVSIKILKQRENEN